MKIQKLHESVENNAQAYATLLTIDEARKLPYDRLEYSNWWWLRSPGFCSVYAACAHSAGYVGTIGCDVDDNGAVRPALKIEGLNQPVGTKFQFGGKTFEVIDDKTAFCLGDIGNHYFNKTSNQGNDYETSDIKKYIDEWFKKSWEEMQL